MNKFRLFIPFILVILPLFNLIAQQSVSIGTTTIDRDAVLFLLGDGNQGLILPKTTDIATMPKKTGMVVYNETDGKVYYCDGTLWITIGGSGGTSTDPKLELIGNNLSIFTGQNVGLSQQAPATPGQILMWNGTAWTTNVTTAPSTNDVLVWNGSRWEPNGNFITTVNGTAPISVTTTNRSAQVTISNITNNEISNTANIADSKLATIGTAGKVSGNAITSGTISGSTNLNTTGTINAGATTVGSLTIGTSAWPSNAAGVLTNNGSGTLSWAPAGSGDITDVVAGTGLTGGATSGLATLNVNVGTGANQIVQLDNTGRLPAIDGSQLTNLPASSGDITDVVAGTGLTGGATSGLATLNVNVGTGANQIPQLDGAGKLIASTLPTTVDVNTTDDITTATLAGGHLAGTYPNPTIANTAASGTAIVNAINSSGGSIAEARIANMTTAGKVSGNAITSGTIGGTTNINTTGTITSGAITATSFSGNGAALTNITVPDGSITGGSGVGAKIAANTITSANLAAGSVTNTQIASGIDATKITTGTLPSAQVPNLDAAKITTGTFAAARIPGLDASAIVSGTLPVSVGGTGRTTWDGLLVGSGSVINDISNGTNGQVLTISAGSPSWQTPTVSGTAGGSLNGTYPNPTIASGAIGSAELAANAVTTTAILNGAVTDDKITSVNPSKLLQASATGGQVLKWNGSAWAPATDDVGGGGAPTLNLGQIIVGNGTTNSGVTVSLDATLNSTNGEITVQGLQGNPISPTPPALNSVYQFNGTQWNPVVLAGGGTVTNIATGTGLTGGPITATGTISIAANGVGTTELGALSVTNAKIAADAVNSAKIADLSIVNADINGSAAIAVTKLAAGTNGQVLTTSAGVPTWVNNAALANPMTTVGDVIYGAAAGAPTRLAGAAGFLKSTGAAAPTWSAVNLASADVTGSLPGSQVTPAFVAQNISTTGTLSSGAITATGNVTASGTVTATSGITAGGSNQFTINNTGNITRINNVVTSFPGTQGAANSVLTNNGSGVLSWSAVPSPFSTANVVPRGDGTTLAATSIFSDGVSTSIGGPVDPSYSLLAYGANASLGIDAAGITLGDVYGGSFGNYFYTDFESAPRFAFMGANVGVGNAFPNYPVDIQTPLNLSTYGLNHTDGDIIMSTYVGNGGPIGGSIGTQSNHPFFIYTANSGAKITVLPNGNVGIGTFTPTANLEVGGFTKLGSNVYNPAIQVAVFTGTTAATEGGSTTISISPLTGAQILSIKVMVNYFSNDSWLEARYNGNPEYDFTWYQSGSTVYVLNSSNGVNGGLGSGNILSKPIKIVVTYTP